MATRPVDPPSQSSATLRRRLVLIAAFVLLALPVSALSLSQAATAGGPDQIGQWSPVVSWPTMGKHLALLPTNEVLAFSTGANAHVWNLATDLHCAGHAALADGRLIVIGGVNVTPQIGIKITAIFDPWTKTWANKTPMKYARWYPSATTLPDGRLIATSGTNENKVKVPIPEIYDPTTDTWTELTGANRVQPFYPFTYVLPDGRVYDVAPKRNTMFLNVSGSGSWSAGPDNGWETLGCCTESGVMYEPGKIMRSGGGDPGIARTGTVDMTVATPQWQETAPMAFPRRRHNTLLLADGTVMAVGGTARPRRRPARRR